MREALCLALARYATFADVAEGSPVVAVMAAAPDLVVLVGDAARAHASILQRLAVNPLTSVVPVALVAAADLELHLEAARRGVAVIPRSASADEMARKIAQLVDAPELDAQGATTGEVATASLNELLDIVRRELQGGILSVEQEGGGGRSARFVLAPGRNVDDAVRDFVERIRPLLQESKPLHFELDDLAGGKLAIVDADGDGGDRALLAGRRILLVEDDASRADALAQELRAHGASVAVCTSRGQGLSRARALDPEIVLVDEDGLGGESYQVLRSIRRDPLLRWASVAVLRVKDVLPEGAPPRIDRLAGSLAPLLGADAEIAERAREETSFETRLEALGPSRLLRAIAASEHTFLVTVRHPRARVEVSIAEGLIAGAEATALEGDASSDAAGDAALAALLVVASGRVKVERREAPASANLLMPVADAIARAHAEDAPIRPSLPPLAAPPEVAGPPTPAVAPAKLVGELERLLGLLRSTEDLPADVTAEKARKTESLPTPAVPTSRKELAKLGKRAEPGEASAKKDTGGKVPGATEPEAKKAGGKEPEKKPVRRPLSKRFRTQLGMPPLSLEEARALTRLGHAGDEPKSTKRKKRDRRDSHRATKEVAPLEQDRSTKEVPALPPLEGEATSAGPRPQAPGATGAPEDHPVTSPGPVRAATPLVGTDAALVATALPSEPPPPPDATGSVPDSADGAAARPTTPAPSVADAVAEVAEEVAEVAEEGAAEVDLPDLEPKAAARERLATDVGIPAFLIEQQAEALRKKAAALRAKREAAAREAEARAADEELARAQRVAAAAASGIEDVGDLADLVEPDETSSLPPAPRSEPAALDDGLRADALFAEGALAPARVPREARTLPSPDPSELAAAQAEAEAEAEAADAGADLDTDLDAPDTEPPPPNPDVAPRAKAPSKAPTPEPRGQREMPTMEMGARRSMPARVDATPWWKSTQGLVAIGAVALCVATAAGLWIRSSRASEPPTTAAGPRLEEAPRASALASVTPTTTRTEPGDPEATEEPRDSAEAEPEAASTGMEPATPTDPEDEPATEGDDLEEPTGGSLGERLDSLVNGGNFYRQRRQFALARRRYEQALRIAPRDGRALFGITRVALAERRSADAVRHARRLVRFHPRPAHHVLLGDAYRASGDLAAARRSWNAALAINPRHRAARSRLGR